jgi:hypothetical protein
MCVLDLATLVNVVERGCQRPSDVEWVFDGGTFWAGLVPELPSPLARIQLGPMCVRK